jgi:hypothetical protein
MSTSYAKVSTILDKNLQSQKTEPHTVLSQLVEADGDK